jgi:hypothetical protein
MSERCFKHPRRKAVDQWKICSDGEWRGICHQCDLELNKLGLRWAFPDTWREKFKAYVERVSP